jgi:hypothetical protein
MLQQLTQLPHKPASGQQQWRRQWHFMSLEVVVEVAVVTG